MTNDKLNHLYYIAILGTIELCKQMSSGSFKNCSLEIILYQATIRL